jgi:hypothetical protein
VLVPTTVVVEVCWLLEKFRGPQAEAQFLDVVAVGGLELLPITPTDVGRMAELVRQYADFPLGAVDASVIALAERMDVHQLATHAAVDLATSGSVFARSIAPNCSSVRGTRTHGGSRRGTAFTVNVNREASRAQGISRRSSRGDPPTHSWRSLVRLSQVTSMSILCPRGDLNPLMRPGLTCSFGKSARQRHCTSQGCSALPPGNRGFLLPWGAETIFRERQPRGSWDGHP